MLATRLITKQFEHFGGVFRKFNPRRKCHVGYGQKLIVYSIKKFEGRTFWAITHMLLSRRTGVEAKAEDYLGITSQEADSSIKGK